MRKTIKGASTGALLALAISGTIISGCKKNEGSSAVKDNVSNSQWQSVKNVDGRLQFASTKALYQTLDSIKNKGTDFLKNWESQQGFKSLRAGKVEEGGLMDTFDFPEFYAAVINEKGEYMVGDTIVWFNKGLKHMVPGRNEAKLAAIKENPATSEISYKAGNVALNSNSAVKSGQTKTMSVQLGKNDGDARYQKEFTHDNDPGSIRKIIFEIQNYVEGSGQFGTMSVLYTRIKQEYKGSKWRPAGETMEKSISNGSYTIQYNSTFDNSVKYLSGSIPFLTQTDGNNLVYGIGSVTTPYGNITATVTGNYHAKVLVAGYSRGIWDVAANW
ncbi:hypothetical protein [Pedobacter cryoconitis]|uniref:hypothetical protein n=1 Tax=Pedobacter cryoconitis TaxID=188932 RepID=UPI0016216055|nr:hypothetical protein [Pedobacter cryoconitis]MBB5648399.1 hypothetical protein [Pedobacter cryoconitis]